MITKRLIQRFTDQTDPEAEVSDPVLRGQYAFLEAGVSIVGNLVLAMLKIAMGLALSSISLLADAAHTASDVVTSVAVLVGFKLSVAPPDEEHPFGHGRAEFLSTLFIGFLLGVVGVQFGLSSFGRLLHGSSVKGNVPVAVVMVVAGLAKEWMTRFALYLGKKADAPALIGDAWHHRTDAVASVLVAVAMVASKHGFGWVDAVLGLGISALILYTGLNLGMGAASSLLGEGASPAILQTIRTAVNRCPGVKGHHCVLVHDYGGLKYVSLHITVRGDLSLSDSHLIASEVERSISSSLHANVVVHMEPAGEEG